jgi:hypothetical protein
MGNAFGTPLGRSRAGPPQALTYFVIIHRVPHLLCCRALEVQQYVYAPDALHLRHPVNAYNEMV